MRLRRLSLLFALVLASTFAALFQQAPAQAAGECAEGAQYFPVTQKCVSALFYQYWVGHGGLAQQGYPVSDEFNEISPVDGKTYLVQYFERARFEYHPENQNNEHVVLLGLLGLEQQLATYPKGTPTRPGPCLAGETYFEQTKHCVRGLFVNYWQSHGALAQQGFPVSDEFEETNPSNGQKYLVQYFERARFEYHAENETTAPDYVVLLGLLGGEQYRNRYPDSIPVEQDSFKDPAHNPLETADTATERIGYSDGGYRIVVKVADQPYDVLIGASNPNPTAAVNRIGVRNQRVDLDFTRVGGGDDALVAVYCRGLDLSNFYLLGIGPGDGHYVIARVRADNYTELVGGASSQHPAAKVGSNPAHLRAECVGDTLTLWVNGQKVAEARDTMITGQQGGFGMVSGKSMGADVIFKNYQLAILQR